MTFHGSTANVFPMSDTDATVQKSDDALFSWHVPPGRLLTSIHIVWIAVALLCALVFAASIPAYYNQLLTEIPRLEL